VTLVSYTLTMMPAEGYEDEVPYYLAIARLDEGPRIFAQMVKATQNPKIGDRVKIVWEKTDAEFPVFKFQRTG